MSSICPDPAFDLKWKKPSRGDMRMLKALRNKDFELAMRFIDVVDLNAKYHNKRASQAIHYASKMERPEFARELLKRGVDVNSKDGDGMTPLLFAIMKSNDEMINLYIEHGADVYAKDGQERNAVYIASNIERLDLIDKFITLGVDPNMKTAKGRTALAKAAWNGQVKVLEHLLKVPSIEIEIADIYHRTALYAAVWGSSGGRDGKKYSKTINDSPECAELLLKHGADIEKQDNKGNTPIFTAADTNAPTSIDLLLKHKANIFHMNKTGKTALHKALKRGFLDIATKLIDAGLSINFNGNPDMTPMMACIYSSNYKSAEFLASFPHLEFDPKYIPTCIKKGCPDILQLLIDRFQLGEIDSQYLTMAIQLQQWKTVFVLAKLCEISLDQVKAASKDREALICLLQYYKGTIGFDIVKSAIEEQQFSLILPYTIGKIDWLTAKETESQSTVLHLLASKGLVLDTQDLLGACEDPQALILMKDASDMTAIDLGRIRNHHSFADFLQSFISEFHSPFKVVRPVYEDLPNDIDLHPLPLPTIHSFPELNYSTAPLSLPEIFVDTPEGLNELRSAILAADLIGLDLECYSIDDSRHYIALIQITVNGLDYIVDALKNRELIGEIMREVMISPTVIKVMHGCDIDLRLLVADFKAFSINIFDTARANSGIHGRKNLDSYAFLVREYFGLVIDKTYQVSDWSIRPLPKPMQQYARTDSHYLPELYTIFRRLMNEEMLNNLQRQMNKLTHKTQTHRFQRIRLLDI